MFLGPSFLSPFLCGTVLSLLWSAALLPTDTVRAQTAETPFNVETRIEFLKYGAMATNVAVSRDGDHVAIGVREVPEGSGQVTLWSRPLNKRVWRRSFATQKAPNVAFDSSGARVAIATGRGTVLLVSSDDGRTLDSRETDVPLEFRSVLETDASTRRLAFGPSTSQAVLRSGDTQITVLNYQRRPTRTIETTNFCRGKVREVKLPANTSNIYFTTEAYAECNPDYLCVVNPSSNALVEKYTRKNISQIEVIDNGEIAYSRGKYVYRFNLQTGVEEVIYNSENTVHDLSHASGRLVIANSDVVILEM